MLAGNAPGSIDWLLRSICLHSSDGALLAHAMCNSRAALLLRATDSNAPSSTCCLLHGRLSYVDHTRPLLRLGCSTNRATGTCLPAVSASQVVQFSRLRRIQARWPPRILPASMGAIDMDAHVRRQTKARTSLTVGEQSRNEPIGLGC